MTVTLTRDEARRIIVRAQLLDADRPGDVVEVAEQLCYLKIDPTATIAPCEHTVLWSRIGWSYEAGQLQKATEIDRQLFDFDGAFRPMSLLPLLLPGMRTWPTRQSTKDWLEANARFRKDVLRRLRDEGPLPASEIPDTAQASRAPDGWYGTNQVPIMLDLLSRQAAVAVVRREGRHKIWDLAERVYALDELPEHTEDEAAEILSERWLQAAGLARQNLHWSGVGKDAGEPARVEGSGLRFRVDPAALAALDDDAGGRVAILNPYDSLLFDRRRLQEVFDFTYVFEQFKPKGQRVYGYFAHPILIGDRFVGMLEAEVDRTEGRLRVDAIHEFLPLDPEEHDMIRAELSDLAEWLGVAYAP